HGILIFSSVGVPLHGAIFDPATRDHARVMSGLLGDLGDDGGPASFQAAARFAKVAADLVDFGGQLLQFPGCRTLSGPAAFLIAPLQCSHDLFPLWSLFDPLYCRATLNHPVYVLAQTAEVTAIEIVRDLALATTAGCALSCCHLWFHYFGM